MALSRLGRSVLILSCIVLPVSQAPGQAPPAADKPLLDLSANKQAHFDGKRVLVLFIDGHGGKKEFHAQVWDAVTGKAVQAPFQHEVGVTYAAFSPDGKRVVTAGYDKKARVWDVETGKPLTPPLVHQATVLHAAFSPDGSKVVTSSEDKTARVWDVATGMPAAPPLTHGATVVRAAFDAEGSRVVTASEDLTARVWDAMTGKPITPPLTHKKKVLDAVFSPDGKRVATAGSFDCARVWDAATGQPVTAPLFQDGLMNRVAFSSDGKRLMTVGRSIGFWDASTGALLHVRTDRRGDIGHAVFHPSLDLILTISTDGKAWIADNRQANPNGPPLVHQNGSNGGVGYAAFSLDGRRVVTIGYKLAQVWDLKTGKVLSTVKKPDIK